MTANSPHKATSDDAPPLRLVFWESTAACNLGCVHCRRLGVGQGAAREDLSTAEARGVIDDITEHHARALLVFSGGEPLLRADLFDLAQAASASGLAMALATNGTLVTPELAQRVAASGFSRVSVSLDGAQAATHDAFRGAAGSFGAALRGLRLVRDAGQAVQINMSVTRANAAELAAMVALAEAEGAAALHVFIVVPVGCGVELGPAQRLSPADYERVLREFYRLSEGSSLATKATCAPQYARIADQLREAGGGPAARTPRRPEGPDARDRQTGGCLAGRGVCFVSHRGDVFPCGYLPVGCGNVRERPLSAIWRTSAVFAALRRPELLKGKCGACRWRAGCGGCRARAYAATGDYLAEEPDCIYRPG